MEADASEALSQHDVLLAEECEDVRAVVLAQRGHWLKRSDAGFFTLGAASYLDAPAGLGGYVQAAGEQNPLLEVRFAALYERMRMFFEDLLASPVAYHAQFALPGFHVYELDGRSRAGDDAARRAHFDLQWRLLFPELEHAATVSFTLPIDVPTGGASMEVWPAIYTDIVRLGMSAKSYALKYPPRAVSYVPGRVVVHDGMMLHAIGRAGSDRPVGHRITLQGHGVKTPNGWLLYW
jgi:hypothetical protein